MSVDQLTRVLSTLIILIPIILLTVNHYFFHLPALFLPWMCIFHTHCFICIIFYQTVLSIFVILHFTLHFFLHHLYPLIVHTCIVSMYLS